MDKYTQKALLRLRAVSRLQQLLIQLHTATSASINSNLNELIYPEGVPAHLRETVASNRKVTDAIFVEAFDCATDLLRMIKAENYEGTDKALATLTETIDELNRNLITPDSFNGQDASL